MPANKTLIGHLACFGAYFIFGLNIVFCKDIANSGLISPLELFALRSLVAAGLFWLVSALAPRQHVPWPDLLRMAAASSLGIVVTQLSFLKAITITRSIDLSIVGSSTPIMTMFVAALVLKEPLSLKKVGGVLLSLSGVIILILNTTGSTNGVDSTSPLGIGLVLLNCLSFALYLGVFRPLIARYSAITLMKWMFTTAAILSVPFAAYDLSKISWNAFPTSVLWQIGFLIAMATFVAYLLIPIGQKHLRPTVVSMYSYIQPVIAVVISIAIGMDKLTWPKMMAAALVFTGVWLVNRSRAAVQKTAEKQTA